MSTYVYLQCLDHDPPLRADDESGQHLYDLPRIQAEIAEREAVVEWLHEDDDERPGGLSEPVDTYFRRHSAWFLAAHLNCDIGVIDEYGRSHPSDPPATEG